MNIVLLSCLPRSRVINPNYPLRIWCMCLKMYVFEMIFYFIKLEITFVCSVKTGAGVHPKCRSWLGITTHVCHIPFYAVLFILSRYFLLKKQYKEQERREEKLKSNVFLIKWISKQNDHEWSSWFYSKTALSSALYMLVLYDHQHTFLWG